MRCIRVDMWTMHKYTNTTVELYTFNTEPLPMPNLSLVTQAKALQIRNVRTIEAKTVTRKTTVTDGEKNK